MTQPTLSSGSGHRPSVGSAREQLSHLVDERRAGGPSGCFLKLRKPSRACGGDADSDADVLQGQILRRIFGDEGLGPSDVIRDRADHFAVSPTMWKPLNQQGNQEIGYLLETLAIDACLAPELPPRTTS